MFKKGFFAISQVTVLVVCSFYKRQQHLRIFFLNFLQEFRDSASIQFGGRT